MLPMLSRSHVDRLIAELQNAEFKLEFEPASTIEYVESLNFLEEIQERVTPSISFLHDQILLALNMVNFSDDGKE